MHPSITLSTEDYDFAAVIGRKREDYRKDRGRSPAEYQDRGGTHYDRHVLGAVTEFALAKFLGDDVLEDWKATKAYSDTPWLITCDVGKNLHVRATRYEAGSLVLTPDDTNTGVFVLARLDDRRKRVTFAGWCYGRDGKQDCLWCDDGVWSGKGRAAYLVGEDCLNDMSTIPPEAVR